MIIAFMGLPGSGKSFLAKPLARELVALYLSSDKIRQEIHEKKYDEQSKKSVYLTMIQQAEKGVARDENVVLDATFYKEKWRQKIIDLANKSNTPVFFVLAKADEEIIKKRLENRGSGEADFQTYKKIENEFDPVREDCLVLDTGKHDIEEMIHQLTNYLL